MSVEKVADRFNVRHDELEGILNLKPSLRLPSCREKSAIDILTTTLRIT